MTATKEEFFKPGKMSPREKASATDEASAQIIAAETAQRLKKTERLREARLAREAETVIIPPPNAPKKRGKASVNG
ncbi:hypothetical protein [Agrobacterium larrymoorei]|uniref:Transcriptional regulator n=1 Tax=Agrobacterium larrymoorei TaxID=160699 RepID=A0A4D7E1Y2_9HYPH|nr:hypothetical protein [Agrobacterium larrymoorei]QCJ00257.1 hypothetical protein CFBP5473_20235 [Agrobacterium larrymoorei]QYA09301.1 hypothetical protein J5285_18120 [Agrobacterium larrymoorei]